MCGGAVSASHRSYNMLAVPGWHQQHVSCSNTLGCVCAVRERNVSRFNGIHCLQTVSPGYLQHECRGNERGNMLVLRSWVLFGGFWGHFCSNLQFLSRGLVFRNCRRHFRFTMRVVWGRVLLWSYGSHQHCDMPSVCKRVLLHCRWSHLDRHVCPVQQRILW